MSDAILRLFTRLKEEGDFLGDLSALPKSDASRDPLSHSIWILMLQSVGAWIGSLFLLGFLVMLLKSILFNGEITILILAALFTISTAFFIRKTDWRNALFLFQSAAACHMVGQILFFLYFWREQDHFQFLMIFFEIGLLFWIPHLFFRVLLAILSFVWLFKSTFFLFENQMNVFFLLLTLPALITFALASSIKKWEIHEKSDVFFSFLWASFFVASWLLLAYSPMMKDYLWSYQEHTQNHHLFFFIPLTIYALLFASFLAFPLPKTPKRILAFSLFLIAIALTWRAPAVSMGALMAIFGFMRGDKWMASLGAILSCAALSYFYYDLSMILLYKSYLLMASGLLLFAIRFLLLEKKGLS